MGNLKKKKKSQLSLTEIRLHCFILEYASLDMVKSSWLLTTKAVLGRKLLEDGKRCQKYGNKRQHLSM